MNIALGMTLQQGPWGGGNQFGRTLSEYLSKQGVNLFHDLANRELDIIVLTEPRSHLKTSAFSDKEIMHYLRRVNPKAIVVHRVNECDERKQTRHVNRRLRVANLCSDYTVFISQWLQEMHNQKEVWPTASETILNGADSKIFHAAKTKGMKHGKLKLVTHHWGGGYLKGFDIYERLDALLEQEPYRQQLEFTYIGNIPKGIHLKNTKVVSPLSGEALAKAIRDNDIYLTASQFEPAGMHHIEGALSGLPLLYRKSGALPEYCRGYGIDFDANDFETKLKQMMSSVESQKLNMQTYPHTTDKMCLEYWDLFQNLTKIRNSIVAKRSPWRFIHWRWQYLFTSSR